MSHKTHHTKFTLIIAPHKLWPICCDTVLAMGFTTTYLTCIQCYNNVPYVYTTLQQPTLRVYNVAITYRTYTQHYTTYVTCIQHYNNLPYAYTCWRIPATSDTYYSELHDVFSMQ